MSEKVNWKEATVSFALLTSIRHWKHMCSAIERHITIYPARKFDNPSEHFMRQITLSVEHPSGEAWFDEDCPLCSKFADYNMDKNAWCCGCPLNPHQPSLHTDVIRCCPERQEVNGSKTWETWLDNARILIKRLEKEYQLVTGKATDVTDKTDAVPVSGKRRKAVDVLPFKQGDFVYWLTYWPLQLHHGVWISATYEELNSCHTVTVAPFNNKPWQSFIASAEELAGFFGTSVEDLRQKAKARIDKVIPAPGE